LDDPELWARLIHPDDRECAGAAMAAHRAAKDPLDVEYRLIRKDGTIRWVRDRAECVLDENGRLLRIDGFVQDITKDKEAQHEIQQRTAQLSALRQVGLEITGQLELDVLLHSIVDRAIELLGGVSGGIYLHCPDRNVLEWVVSQGPDMAPVGTTLSRGEGLSGRVWHTGQPLVVDDYRSWAGQAKAYQDNNWTAVLGVPIFWGSQFLGVLDVLDNSPRRFSPSDVSLLEMFATHAAIAIRNAQMYDALRQELAERERAEKEREQLLLAEHEQRLLAEILSETTLALVSKLGHEAVLDELLRQAQRIVPYNMANIALLEGNSLHTVHSRGYQDVGAEEYLHDLRQPLSDCVLDARAVRSRTPVVIPDTHLEPRWLTIRETAWIRSYMNVPICLHDRVIGLIRLDGDATGAFTMEDAQRLQPLANAAAIALENARLYEQARQDAETKAMLLQEVHHRVKNNLQIVSSLLDLQADVIQDPGAIQVLQDSQHRVRAMALIHETLYQSEDLATLDLAGYVQKLVDYLRGAYHGYLGRVKLRAEVDEVPLGLDQAIPCGLIICELATNALKHAFPGDGHGDVLVSLHIEGDQARLRVGDDGIGVPDDLDPSATRSLGLRLVHLLSRQLRGTLQLERSGGTAFTVMFPLSQERSE
jgi:two-component sensor histidine kinase